MVALASFLKGVKESSLYQTSPYFFKVSQTKRHVKQGAARFGANTLCVSGTALIDMRRFKAI